MRISDLTIHTTKFEKIKASYSRLGFEVIHENPNGLVELSTEYDNLLA